MARTRWNLTVKYILRFAWVHEVIPLQSNVLGEKVRGNSWSKRICVEKEAAEAKMFILWKVWNAFRYEHKGKNEEDIVVEQCRKDQKGW